jgi:hypothetical protein
MNNNGWQKARRETGLRLVRVHDLRTHSHADCERQAFRPKIAKHCLATPIIQWRVITRVRTSVACSNRPTCFWIDATRGRCYVSLTAPRCPVHNALLGPKAEMEDLILRGNYLYSFEVTRNCG